VLLDLKSDLLKGRIEDTFEFAGRRFRLHTLSDGEALWRDQYVSMASNMALLSSRKSATVAAACSHVNDVPIAELFPLPQDPQLLGLIKNDAEEMRSYFRERLYEFLQQFDDAIITEFFTFYGKLEERRAEVITRLKAPSRETDSSTSSTTASVEDGLSSAEGTTDLEEVAPAIHGSSFSA
jgi:hypothetical protein